MIWFDSLEHITFEVKDSQSYILSSVPQGQAHLMLAIKSIIIPPTGIFLQGQASKTNTQTREETVEQLLHNGKEVVDHSLQAQQQAGKGRHERVQASEERCCTNVSFALV